MPYSFFSFISVSIFSLVHLLAARTRHLEFTTRGQFLSAGGGIAISYVFVDLLPKLCESDIIVKEALSGVFPYFERHVFIMALAGFLLFFMVDRSSAFFGAKGRFWLSLSSYTLFNFLVGYAVADKDNPEVKPLVLFTLAIALHYFINDYSISKDHGKAYNLKGKWILILSLFLGWLTGMIFVLSPTAVALVTLSLAAGSS